MDGCDVMAAQFQGSDPLITYTLFPSVTPRSKSERADVPWSELVARIQNSPTYTSKASCPLVSLAEYGDEMSQAACLRHAANVRRIFGVELDYDGEQMPIEEAAALVQRANLEAVLYTSPSHTPQRPRWRILLPLGDPETPEKRAEFVGRANRIIGGTASRESFTLSQSFYIGRVRGAEYVVIPTHGRTLDLASEIEPQYHVAAHNDGESKFDKTSDEQLRAAFFRGEDRYQAMLKLSARWAARGMAADDIEAALHALLDECPGGTANGDGVDLRTRCRPMAESAWRKFGETRAAEQPRIFLGTPPSGATPFIDWTRLSAQEPPAREWAIEGWLGRGHVTLLAGPPGAGKTAVCQSIASALRLGRQIIDNVPRPMNVLFWAGEDDADEIWRRQVAIARWLGEPLSAFADGLYIDACPDRDITLAGLVDGVLVETPMLAQLREQIGDLKIDAVFLDSVARTYGGNENDRHQVTKYMAMLTSALSPTRAAMCLLGHPAKAAGSEFSGSTAWEASVRARLYFGYHPPGEKPDDENPPDDNVRWLAKRKTNYSQRDIREVRFADGCMQPANPPTGEARSGRSNEFLMDEAVRITRRLRDMGLNPGASLARNYMPALARDNRLLEGITERELKVGLAEAMKAGRLKVGATDQLGHNRMPKVGLIEG